VDQNSRSAAVLILARRTGLLLERPGFREKIITARQLHCEHLWTGRPSLGLLNYPMIFLYNRRVCTRQRVGFRRERSGLLVMLLLQLDLCQL